MVNPFKGDKEKLAQMNFRQKVDYIWTYYKFWIIAIIIVIAFVVAFIQAQLAYNPNAMTILMCDSYCNDSETAYSSMNQEFPSLSVWMKMPKNRSMWMTLSFLQRKAVIPTAQLWLRSSLPLSSAARLILWWRQKRPLTTMVHKICFRI